MKNKTFQLATFLSLMFCTINLFATDYTLSTAANIANQCYAVGDTVTISDNSVDAVMGEKIATISSLFMKNQPTMVRYSSVSW